MFPVSRLSVYLRFIRHIDVLLIYLIHMRVLVYCHRISSGSALHLFIIGFLIQYTMPLPFDTRLETRVTHLSV